MSGGPRLDLTDEHLHRARTATLPYEVFDAAWKAFNVLYEAEHRAGQPNDDRALIARAVARLAPEILGRLPVAALASIDPIFDEKTRERAGVIDRTKHNVVRRRLRELNRRAPAMDDVVAVVEILYVVRCNLMHGFKTATSLRDQEVLAAAAPLLLPIVEALRATWPGIGVS